MTTKVDPTISGFSEKRAKLIALFQEVPEDQYIPYQVMTDLISERVTEGRGYSIMDSARTFVLKNHNIILHTKRGGGLLKSSEEEKIQKVRVREKSIKNQFRRVRTELGAIDTTKTSERVTADVNIRKELYAGIEARLVPPGPKQLSAVAKEVQRKAEDQSRNDDLKRALKSVEKVNLT